MIGGNYSVHNNNGYTLVECMISMVLSVGLALAVGNVIPGLKKQWKFVNQELTITEKKIKSIQLFKPKIKNATVLSVFNAEDLALPNRIQNKIKLSTQAVLIDNAIFYIGRTNRGGDSLYHYQINGHNDEVITDIADMNIIKNNGLIVITLKSQAHVWELDYAIH